MALGFGCAAPAGEEEVEPIVIGFVGNVASPGTKPDMDVVEMAVEEINAAGGILGHSVECVAEDSKGETALSVEAMTRLLVGHHCSVLMCEGRTEIGLALQEKSAMAYHDYPHIFLIHACTGREIRDYIFDEPEKLNHWFCPWTCEPQQLHWGCTFFDLFTKLGIKKIALLFEDLAWTTTFRNGDEELGIPTWAGIAEERHGLEVVYEEATKARAGMYLPILEACAASGAEAILMVSSWFTDTEVMTKQWAESTAKDIPLFLYGGLGQTEAFWPTTGGKCLGVVTISCDVEVPLTDAWISFIHKTKERGIPVQLSPHFAYGNVYLLKAAMEKAGTTDDIEAIIKALEEVEIDFPFGKLSVYTKHIKPYYRSWNICDPADPYHALPGVEAIAMAQWQEEGKRPIIFAEPESLAAPFAHLDEYKTPNELRKEAGWPGY
jgi:branched-chain amino acid transport system substrate-binding protein